MKQMRMPPSSKILWGFLVLMLLLGGCGGGPAHVELPPVVDAPPAKSMVPATYRVGMGDELEILYHIDPGIAVPDYVIDSEDSLRIDFFYYPVMSKTVRVRPDGYITLPRVGDIQVRGKKPTDLAKEISLLYRPHLSRPVTTVEVIGFNTKVEELKRTIYNQERGMSRLAVVRPDGKISLPYIGDVTAAGLTSPDLQQAIEDRYRRMVNNLSVTVIVLRARSNRVYVMGQVNNPNFYGLPGPITLTQLIAMAGGFSREAKTDQVIIVRRKKNGQPEAHIVFTGEIINANSLNDPMIQQHDVVYVPRSTLAKAALSAESLWRIIPLSFVVSGNYELGGRSAD